MLINLSQRLPNFGNNTFEKTFKTYSRMLSQSFNSEEKNCGSCEVARSVECDIFYSLKSNTFHLE